METAVEKPIKTVLPEEIELVIMPGPEYNKRHLVSVLAKSIYLRLKGVKDE